MKSFFKKILLALCSVYLTACGTAISLAERDYRVYGGVKRDFETIQEGTLWSMAAVVDVPLSFVLDTLVLPLTLTQ
ncbi:hypothetical protein RZ65_05030 [[Haemophilus] ducreyi]|uniref:YceK/YidQ family lipoprotein n=1 Tax=Haemophilus ducreyi TaxID=730 RepID=UPI000656422B|nr:YceK/YidQ family lipoprotein [[Haemophilus] ducreyi]AKO37416.1 hypothetical protein RZ61_05245 [[Haemophilus] ducreyi]AKO38960.1 hypothetical protein RZ62_05370 [[Haemophilus] ducreyi]AKO41364.1 hypothetical protein RZ64_05165 [[Haemophilus] ducreyi]AKO42820.1 hypothetical protein RZ65_05030 [[Haemophilus] ducreyi]ANF70626.1 hypothetical protein A6043_04520 [[Haemophilus] ducreyi]